MITMIIKLTRSLWEPGGPCTKSMEVSECRMERVNNNNDKNNSYSNHCNYYNIKAKV